MRLEMRYTAFRKSLKGTDEELGDLTAPPQLDAGVRDISLVADLDVFFSHLHEYHREQGLFPYLSARLCNLLALAFTIVCSGVLLLGVNWDALRDPCVKQKTCDLSDVIFYSDPLRRGSYAWRCGVLTYLLLFTFYWVWGLVSFLVEMREMAGIRAFLRDRVGVSDTEITSLSWPEILERVLRIQTSTRLTITSRHLTELDVVARLLRKDHYLLGLLNSGVLDLSIRGLLGASAAHATASALRNAMPPAADGPAGFAPFRPTSGDAAHDSVSKAPPEGRGWNPSSSSSKAERERECSTSPRGGGSVVLPPSAHFLFTHTLEWNLRWVLLDWMFGPKHRLKPASLLNPWTLRRRLRLAALLNLAVSPFLAVFLCIFYFLRNAEHFYHHPGSAGARRWSPLAHWQLREWNELGQQLESRVDLALPSAEKYVAQFRSRSLVYAARLVSFLAGSFAALILALALVDDDLLERPLYGRNLVWWAAGFGVVLAVARGLADEETRAYDPEGCLGQVAALIRYYPAHWRGRAHKETVYREFVSMVPPRPLLFLQELISVVTNPLLLGILLPAQADQLCTYLIEASERVDGLGDVVAASMMVQRPAQGRGQGGLGDSTASSPPEAPSLSASQSLDLDRARMERSLLSFCLQYPSYQPGPDGLALLKELGGKWIPGRGVVPTGTSVPQQLRDEGVTGRPRLGSETEGRVPSFRFLGPADSVVLTPSTEPPASASSSLVYPSGLNTVTSLQQSQLMQQGLYGAPGGSMTASTSLIQGGMLTPGQLQKALLSQSLHRSLVQQRSLHPFAAQPHISPQKPKRAISEGAYL